MASDELMSIIDEIKKHGKMHFCEAATDEQLEMFESEHAIKLPEKYKEWLRVSDGGDFFLPAGIQMYGVAHKPIIDISDNDRPDDKYVVIGSLASGDPIIFERSSERISIYNHEAERIEDDETYEDFFAFLKDLHDLLGIGE